MGNPGVMSLWIGNFRTKQSLKNMLKLSLMKLETEYNLNS